MHLSFMTPSVIRRRLYAWVQGRHPDCSLSAPHQAEVIAPTQATMISIANNVHFSGANAQLPPRHRPMRVVHVRDASAAHKGTGRMVISGRMADVCAELERLAATEALLH